MAFTEMEAKARSSLRMLYDCGLESPLAGAKDGPAKLLPFLVRALEDVALGLGPTAEAEARVLSSAALMRVLTHIYLCDPSVDLDGLLLLVAYGRGLDQRRPNRSVGANPS